MTDEEKRAKKAANNHAHYLANKEKIAARRASNRDSMRAARAKYYAENRDEVLKRVRAYTAANRDKVAASQRKTKYGITQDQYEMMMSAQNFSCAICQTT